MAKKQVNVTDITIEKIDIESSFGKYDLVPHLEELNIYEDIFSNHITGHITLQDAYNIPYKLPIVGEETIDCAIRLEGDDGKFIIDPPLLHVHELSDRFLKTNQSQRFSLDLVSEQYMSNQHARVSKSYSSGVWTADEIVSDIWSNYLDDGHGDLFVENTKPIDCIIPNWRPHDAFNWLCERVQPEDHDNATNYLYYETMDGTHFKSLNHMIEVQADQEENRLIFAKEHMTEDPFKIGSLASGLIKVDSITYINQFQKVKNINEGYYSSKLITHDIVRKKILQHNYDGFIEWLWINHTAPFPPLSNSDTELQTGNTFRTSYAPDESSGVTEGKRLSDYTDSAVSFYPKHNQMYSVNPDQKHDNKVEEWRLRRAGNIAMFDGITMQVQCAGLSFIRVGLLVTLNVASPETTSRGKSDIAFDKFLTGTYMITAIRHIFSNDMGETGYKMIIEMTKDGLNDVATGRVPRKSGNQ
jgi:hypothetical protein